MTVTVQGLPQQGDLMEHARRLRLLADSFEAEAMARLQPTSTSEQWWEQIVPRSRETGLLDDKAPAEELVSAAVLFSFRGDVVSARELAARAERVSDGAVDLHLGISFARAIAWMGDGKCDAAFDALSAEFVTLNIHRSTAALASTAGVLAEIATRAHRSHDARAVLEPWLPKMVSLEDSERQEFDLALILLHTSDRVAALRDALATPRGWTSFATARLNLALGMALRREQRARDCRSHLLVAADLLAQLDAAPWLTVARNELRASGVRDHSERGSLAVLSAQERSVVELASRGLSNREIGERLFLSPRTVGSHLYRVFPKLGITSRHELVRAVERTVA